MIVKTQYDFLYNQPNFDADQYNQTQKYISKQKVVFITNSTFINLNYGSIETALGSLIRDKNSMSQSTGMILTINQFNGPIEFLNNTVSHNMVLIHDAMYSNAPKPNGTIIENFGMKAFESKKTEFQPKGAYLNFRKMNLENDI